MGNWKTRVVKVYQAGRQLSEVGNSSAALDDVVQKSTAFIADCYGYEEATAMSDVGLKMWKVKTAKANIVSAPKFMSLPSKNESFRPNMLRAHMQCCIWKHSEEATRPTLHWWKRGAMNETFQPTLLPGNMPVAPHSILQLINCG